MGRSERVAGWLIAASAAVVAAATASAAWYSSAANGVWQQSTRAEGAAADASVEQVRKLYEDEAPSAFRVTTMEVRADELDRRATDPTVAEAAQIERMTATALRAAHRQTAGSTGANELIASDRYRTPDGGLDLEKRLTDLRAHTPARRDDGAAAAAERAARRASLSIAAMVATASTALIGALIVSGRSRSRPVRHRALRRRLPAVGAVMPRLLVMVGRARSGDRAATVGAADPSVERPAVRHRTVLVSVAVAAVATIVTGLQVQAGMEENRALAATARQASEIGALAVGGGLRRAFAADAQRQVIEMEVRATAAREAAGPADRSAGTAFAEAELAAAVRLRAIATREGAAPRAGTRLDPFTAAVVAGNQGELQDRLSVEHRTAAQADAAGTRSNRLVIALFLTTLGGLLVEAAGGSARRRMLIRVATRATFALAAVTAISSYL